MNAEMFSKGSRVRNTRWNYVGTVQKSLGSDRWLVHADKPGGVYTPVEAAEADLVPIGFLDIPIAGESRETRAVMLYLKTEVRMHHSIADGIRLDSVEQFKQDAMRTLGDATEVTQAELEGADWETIFSELKEEHSE